MSLSKRSLVLAATATTLGIGGMLLPGASAMAATTEHSATAAPASAAAPASPSSTQATQAPSEQPDYVCAWVYLEDGSGNWYYAWECYY